MARQTAKEKIESTVAQLLGTSVEPKIEKIGTQGELSALLNWYHAHKDAKDAIRYINDYVKKNKVQGKLSTEDNIMTAAWLCRIVSNGVIVPDNVTEFLTTKFPAMFKVEKTPSVVNSTSSVVEKTSIQDRISEKVSEVISELNGAIDDYILSGCKVSVSPYVIMRDKVKAVHATKIIDVFKKVRTEFDDVLHTKDEQLIEGYSNFTKAEIKKLVAYCDSIITDANKLSDESKVTRKPRKRKVKTPEQLVSKIIICDESKDYNLKSESAKNIIGASSIWVFNIKNKKLGVYHALDSEGLSVKGTSLINFSEMKSIQKTLRKPNDILPNVVKGGKIFLRNVLEDLSTVDTKLNGRLNKDVIIVKVIK